MSKLAFPKPRKKKPRPRRFGSSLPIPEKGLKSGGTSRKTKVKPRNAKRRASTFERCYHSAARVNFVRSLCCAASGRRAELFDLVENAHVCDDGTKGAGRKSGYKCIAPLRRSVHRLLHNDPERFARLYPHFNAEAAAAATEAAWQSHVAVHPERK